MYRIVLIPLALLLLLIFAVILIPLIADKETILDLATSALQRETGATLTVAGDTKVTLFPILGISLSNVAVNLPEREHYDLQARSVKIGVDVLPLFKGDIKIETVRLDGLIVRTESGAKQANSDSRRSNLAGDGFAALAVPLTLNVKRLLITDARWEEVDSAAAVSTTLELIKLQAKNLNPEHKPIPIEMHLRLLGEQPAEVTLRGAVRVNKQTQKVNLDELLVGIGGATTMPMQIQTSGSIDLSRETADLKLKFQSGETHGTGSLHYANAGSPRIKANLQLNLLDETLLALTGVEAAAAAGKGPTGGDEALPLGAMRLIDTEVVLDVASAHFGDHTVNNLHVKLRALKGMINATDMTGNLHGGRLVGSGSLDGREKIVTINTEGRIARVDIASALATTNSAPKLSGSATVSWKLRSQGRSSNELIAALNGPLTLTTEAVVLQGTSIEKTMCRVVALTNNESLTATFPANTHFESLFADVQIANGSAILNPFRAQLNGIALTGRGNYDLVKQDFVATFKGRLSETLKQLDDACRVSKRLTAIDWPVSCAGSLSTKPSSWCHMDTAQLLQDPTVNEGLDKLEKKAGKLFKKLFN